MSEVSLFMLPGIVLGMLYLIFSIRKRVFDLEDLVSLLRMRIDVMSSRIEFIDERKQDKPW